MFQRDKKINMKYSRSALILEVLSWLLVVGVLVYVIQVYPSLGDTVATSFGANGQASEWGAKAVVLMQPIAAVFVYIVLTGIGVVMRRAVLPGEEYPVLERVLLAVLGVKCVYLAYKLGKCYFVLGQRPVPLWLDLAFVAVLLMIVALCICACIKRGKRTCEQK